MENITADILEMLIQEKRYSLETVRNNFSKAEFDESIGLRARELAGYAHLSCFNFDGREMLKTIEYFNDAGNSGMLKELLRISRLYGNIRAILRLKEIAREKDIQELEMPDFDQWFILEGIKWADIYVDDEKEICFINNEDRILFSGLLDRITLNSEARQCMISDILTCIINDPRLTPERKVLIFRLVNNEETVVNNKELKPADVDLKFRNYCKKKNLIILKKLQTGVRGVDQCSFVYLVKDQDGIIKVYKELINHKTGRLGYLLNNEDEIYLQLPQGDSYPRYYGTIEIENGIRFLKRSVMYGQPLADFFGPGVRIGVDEACGIIARIAKKLQWLLAHNVLYLDVKPENFLLSEDGISLMDLGHARIVKDIFGEVDVFLAEPRYGAPETGTRLKASAKSMIFQLGVMFHELLTGKHPFCIGEASAPNRESEILKYFWPNIVLGYGGRLDKEFGDNRLAVIAKMLDKDPDKRPDLDEIIGTLSGEMAIKFESRKIKIVKEKNTVLFPARMGIPHRGHIEFMSRIMEMGYYLLISIQRSYTLTDDDPLPKWLVMKMVAQALLARGFNENQFNFILTPFYGTDREHKMHFAMMPGIENVIAVATGNPGVHHLFPRLPIFDQQSVFGIEGEKYNDRSWGSILRKAIKEDDFSAYREFIAPGSGQILDFEEIKKMYLKDRIEFVSGQVSVELIDENGESLFKIRVQKYGNPETSMVNKLAEFNRHCSFLDKYGKISKILLNDKIKCLIYRHIRFDGKNETITYEMA